MSGSIFNYFPSLTDEVPPGDRFPMPCKKCGAAVFRSYFDIHIEWHLNIAKHGTVE